MEDKQEYLKKFKPSLDRTDEKYYEEMQDLAYNLVKYLKMNEDEYEHDCQGNWNLTFIRENMTETDYKYIVEKMMRSLKFKDIQNIIKNWGNESYNIVFGNEEEKETKKKDNNELLGCGKKYEIQYFSGQHYKNAIDNGGGHFKTVKGTLINYDSPFTGRFFLENDNGALEIIPMASVVEMREIE